MEGVTIEGRFYAYRRLKYVVCKFKTPEEEAKRLLEQAAAASPLKFRATLRQIDRWPAEPEHRLHIDVAYAGPLWPTDEAMMEEAERVIKQIPGC